MLQVKNLKTYYYTEEGVIPAVDGLDFEVEQGETFAIVGESGCGKSVTSLSILGLIPSPPGKILDGEIIYNGEDLLKKTEKSWKFTATEFIGKAMTGVFPATKILR